MEVRVLENITDQIDDTEIINIDFDIENLVITVSQDGFRIDVTFEDPAGYRVLDEGDLLEFWPSCSMQNGWLYQIMSGGWLEQETNRVGFLLSNNDEVREYFVIGTNFCVGVFAWSNPRVEESIR